MTERAHVEYFFLRYVPNVLSDIGVNLAAIFVDSVNPENGICTMAFAPDWESRVCSLDPDADIGMLVSLLKEIRERLLVKSESSAMIHQMEDSFSNVIQISERRECPVDPSPQSIKAFADQLF